MTRTKKRRLKEAKQKRRLARKLATYSVTAGASIFAAGLAEATIVNDFTAEFAPGNWTTFNDPAGTVAGGGPSAKLVAFTGGNTVMDIFSGPTEWAIETNGGGVSVNPGWQGGSTILAPGNGTMSFDWSITTSPSAGVSTTLVEENASSGETKLSTFLGTTAGSAGPLTIVAGEPIIFTLDNHYGSLLVGYGFGSLSFKISNFTADFEPAGAAVPEPEALPLLALGAVGLAGMRRRRRKR